VTFPTWGELMNGFCIHRQSVYYEDFANRRYNYAPTLDNEACRLIFLKDVLKNDDNRTLQRQGRFIWCKELQYEGRNSHGYRQLSFSVDHGKKRFLTSERNTLCLPSTLCVSNNRYFKSKSKLFHPFSSVFAYEKTIKMMADATHLTQNDFKAEVLHDSPYKPGTLIIPRRGYFHPEVDPNNINVEIKEDEAHPCGIILGPQLIENKYVAKEFYRVRFGATTYERVHPVQMEIINEI
jgi:hypothetical protein